MNATLQCLSQIEKLVNYFKYRGKVEIVIKKMKNQDCLTESFKNLIENLWPTEGSKYLNKKYISKNSNNKYFIPEEFKKKISKMNSLFEGVQANDAKDLVNFIVMTLRGIK
jgi:ubiquitin C-terminal hydrolase